MELLECIGATGCNDMYSKYIEVLFHWENVVLESVLLLESEDPGES